MFKSKRTKKQINCYHLNAVAIYGDAIRHSGWNRGYCHSCHAYLKELPPRKR